MLKKNPFKYKNPITETNIVRRVLGSTIFISDIHLRSRHLSEEAKEVLRLILSQSDEYECIVLLGDIYDLTRSEDNTEFEEEFNTLIKKFSRRFACIGNHEWPFTKGAELYKNIDTEIYDRFRFKYRTIAGIGVHGYQTDPNCKGENLFWNRSLVKGQVFIDKIVSKIKGKPFSIQGWLRSFSWIDEKLEKVENDLVIEQNLIEEYNNSSDLIISGHTHRPSLRQRKDGGLYANCGSFVDGNMSYLTIKDGKISLIKYTKEDLIKPNSIEIKTLYRLLGD